MIHRRQPVAGGGPAVHPGEAALHVAYERDDGREAALATAAAGDVLAVVRFGEELPAGGEARLIPVPLRQVGDVPVQEVWRSGRPVAPSRHGDIRYASSGGILFGHIFREEGQGASLEDLTTDLYRTVFTGVRDLGHPYVWRMWNVFGDINGREQGLERYQAFCRGRHRALAPILPDFERRLPAASAIGGRLPGLAVSFLAGAEPAEQVENPRQVSAFRYPRRYGPKSPSFSRAVLRRWGTGGFHLYVSGTASIVGDESRHVGDFDGQLAEALDNFEALLAAAAERAGTRLRPALLRFYLRDPGRAESVRAVAARRFGPVPVLLLQGEICRTDLLLEVEGIALRA